ncbi:MAG: hypothetical protein JW860_08120 [Sedimentisphaerales bacterium]|nr:hypothetical protein [Sedimentisphaerales bacterium]
MDVEIIIGCVIIALALGGIIALNLWSRRTINRIAQNGYRTARQTLREMQRDK